MKTIKQIITVALFGFFALNVNSQITQKKEASNFDEISLSVPGKLILTQGNSYSVELEGYESDLNKIETEVRANTLLIKLKKNHYRIKNVILRVTMPEIKELNVAGSGIIKAATPIKAEDLVADISGSGEICIDKLNANNLELDISGSGNIKLTGTGKLQTLKFSISGSGDIDACGLEVSDIEGDISGSGSACIWATDALDADIAGSGRISYKGNPEKLHTNVSGSGKIRKKN